MLFYLSKAMTQQGKQRAAMLPCHDGQKHGYEYPYSSTAKSNWTPMINIITPYAKPTRLPAMYYTTTGTLALLVARKHSYVGCQVKNETEKLFSKKQTLNV